MINFRPGVSNNKLRKSKRQIRTSHIVLGLLGCVFCGTMIVFGRTMHFLFLSSSIPQHHEQFAHAGHRMNHFDHQHHQAPPFSAKMAKEALEIVNNQFYKRYGGQAMAKQYLEKTITFFGSVEKTADRILQAIAQGQPFVMGFAGYSITVGRGNFFNQSFPFVVERVLKNPMRALGVSQFVVRNSAIGGIPSFPYAYCLDHFVSKDTDVLSWDFSMNEKAKDPAVFEAYVRQALHQLPKQPMIIMVDNNSQRAKLLEDYVQRGLLQGAMTVAKADAVIDATLLQADDSQKPPGLQQWEEFGAPAGCPGKGSWHPKQKEHEFMGWMIAMHFVQALEKVYQIQTTQQDWKQTYAVQKPHSRAIFPDPLSVPPPDNDQSVTDILFGHQTSPQHYEMKALSCRTNFLPATDTSRVLQSLVVAGHNPQATADNIMKARSDADYTKGWNLDVSQVERDTKVKVEKCGGLGYIDMKIALYGIPESGTLELFLPYENIPPHASTTTEEAQQWFDGLIICEANDKRPKEACQLDRDIDYVVGGIPVPSVAMINGAGEYLKRKTCVSVGVPNGAQTMQRNGNLGLQVKITAKGKVTRKDGACCISHVVWEQH